MGQKSRVLVLSSSVEAVDWMSCNKNLQMDLSSSTNKMETTVEQFLLLLRFLKWAGLFPYKLVFKEAEEKMQGVSQRRIRHFTQIRPVPFTAERLLLSASPSRRHQSPPLFLFYSHYKFPFGSSAFAVPSCTRLSRVLFGLAQLRAVNHGS